MLQDDAISIGTFTGDSCNLTRMRAPFIVTTVMHFTHDCDT